MCKVCLRTRSSISDGKTLENLSLNAITLSGWVSSSSQKVQVDTKIE